MNESTNSWFLKEGAKMKAKYLSIGVVVLFIAGVLTASSFAELDPETCVGVWLFDEGEGDIAADSSGEGNDAPFWVTKQSIASLVSILLIVIVRLELKVLQLLDLIPVLAFKRHYASLRNNWPSSKKPVKLSFVRS